MRDSRIFGDNNERRGPAIFLAILICYVFSFADAGDDRNSMHLFLLLVDLYRPLMRVPEL